MTCECVLLIGSSHVKSIQTRACTDTSAQLISIGWFAGSGVRVLWPDRRAGVFGVLACTCERVCVPNVRPATFKLIALSHDCCGSSDDHDDDDVERARRPVQLIYIHPRTGGTQQRHAHAHAQHSSCRSHVRVRVCGRASLWRRHQHQSYANSHIFIGLHNLWPIQSARTHTHTGSPHAITLRNITL